MQEHAEHIPGVATAFLPNYHLQTLAAVAVLNNHVGQGALNFLDFVGLTGRRVVIEARMPTQRVRCADATKVWTQELDAACMVLDRTEDEYGIHVHTFYPILGYRRDCPSWWPDGIWQFPTGHPRRP
jgi:hypothetical protein